jgi:hypothetical protein
VVDAERVLEELKSAQRRLRGALEAERPAARQAPNPH